MQFLLLSVPSSSVTFEQSQQFDSNLKKSSLTANLAPASFIKIGS